METVLYKYGGVDNFKSSQDPEKMPNRRITAPRAKKELNR
jgi:hypothetical protein